MTTAIPSDTSWSSGRAWFTVGLFMLLYVCSMLDRNIVSVLVTPIKQELGASDFQLGLLMGPAFGVSYVVLALPLAWLADRWSRRGTVFIGIVIWSISNCAAGLTHSFEALLATRVGVGAGEAALVPAAYVLIGQLFPRRSLALALSIFSMGAIGGLVVGFGLGGWMLDRLGIGFELPLVGHMAAWRLVFFFTGLPSLALGLLLYFVPERKKQLGASAPKAALLPFLRAHPWPAIGIPIAFAMASLCSAAMIAWVPAFAMREFNWSATKMGLVMACLLAGIGTVGKLASGFFADRLFARGSLDGHPRYLMTTLIIATPAAVAAFFAGPTSFVILLGVWFLVAYSVQGYGAAAIQLFTPEPLRGRMSAMFIIVINLMTTTGPSMVGYLSDYVLHTPGQLGPAIAITVAAWSPPAIVLLWLLLTGTRRAVLANLQNEAASDDVLHKKA